MRNKFEGPEQKQPLTRKEVAVRLEESQKSLFEKVGLGPSETSEQETEKNQLMTEAGEMGYLAALLKGERLLRNKPLEPADILKVLEEKIAAREDIKAGRRRDTRFANSTPVEKEIERFKRQIRILKEAAGL